MQRNLCIELLDEDMSERDKAKDVVGYLNHSLYGIRGAAVSLQQKGKEVRGNDCRPNWPT